MGPVLHGHAEPGFARVADAFASNFTARGERGAACTIVVEGVTVVDLYAGTTSTGTSWTESTRTPVFSVSKAVTTICLLMAAEQALLDLDAPVASYWPEFAVNGKETVTVRHALAHRAGVIGFTRPWDADALTAWTPIIDDLAAQVPLWEPDSAFCYHPVSFGFIAGEVLRRATGLRPSQWLSQHLGHVAPSMTYGARPADSDYSAVVAPPPGDGAGIPFRADDLALVMRAMLADGAYSPDLFTASTRDAFLGPESPAVNLVTTARDLAHLFSATVHPVDSPAILSAATVAAATKPLSFGKPFIGPDKGDVWGTGFMLHSTRRGMAGPGSFGHDGAGGHLAFAHPGFGIGFGYQTSQAGNDDDIRAEVLSKALRDSL
ncbi:serine hydrolase domain-containing protein [Paenarthrobacter nicotinovorans]|uniref:serine hydrolase domain-containing protein n=1 Tax=Paenarthrobacter nicotinovorans TaxID=29320 RepID=UPI003D66D58D